MFRRVTRVVGALSLAACAYKIQPPAPSGVRYAIAPPPPPPLHLALVDSRRPETFDNGAQSGDVWVNQAPLSPPDFFTKYVSAELDSRGLPTKLVQGADAPPKIELRRFDVQNHQINQWTMLWTSTVVSADVVAALGTKRIAVWVRRGKVGASPKTASYSQDLIGVPLAIAVQEFSSKLANHLYGYRASDSEVERLLAKLAGPRTNQSWLDVYALGFTNDPRAVEPMVRLTEDKDEVDYVRLAAISSLGTLRATDQLPLLMAIYADLEHAPWEERAMALKSIADLDTPETNAFIRAEMDRLVADSAYRESYWMSEVLELYL